MNSEHRQRKSSLERYQPKRNESDELSDTLNSLSLNGQQDQQNHIPTKHVKSNNKPRRGVNSHLYGNNQQDSRASQGRGRGRGSNRGPPHQNQQDKTTFSSSFSPDNEEKQQDHHQQTQSWGQRSSSDRGANITFQATNASSRHRQSNHQTRNEMNQIDRNYHNKASKRNTETFKPSHKPAEMRILCAPESWMKYSREVQSRDVIIVNGLFCQPDDLSLYEKLLSEIKTSGIDQEDLWKLWHGDSHVIADDKLKWKEACPTFHLVLHKIQEYFEMDIKATRLNWYRDSKEWKPFHHDAAAIKPDKAKTQNLTVGVSFGAERDAAFEHAKTKTVMSMPQPNGTIYVFAKDVNIIWRHGILQVPPENYHKEGRISIIAWGWAAQTPV